LQNPAGQQISGVINPVLAKIRELQACAMNYMYSLIIIKNFAIKNTEFFYISYKICYQFMITRAVDKDHLRDSERLTRRWP
jgi:hypothetical protein